MTTHQLLVHAQRESWQGSPQILPRHFLFFSAISSRSLSPCWFYTRNVSKNRPLIVPPLPPPGDSGHFSAGLCLCLFSTFPLSPLSSLAGGTRLENHSLSVVLFSLMGNTDTPQWRCFRASCRVSLQSPPHTHLPHGPALQSTLRLAIGPTRLCL